MYGFCYATLVGNTIEEVEQKVEQYRKYPFFSCGAIRETMYKWKRLGKFMVVINYFNND